MIYSINGNVGGALVTTDFNVVVEDLLDGNKYKIGINAKGEVYSELSTATTKNWVFQDIATRGFFKVLSMNGEIQVAPYMAATGDVDLSAIYLKLDQLLACACVDKNENTSLPFKMYSIE